MFPCHCQVLSYPADQIDEDGTYTPGGTNKGKGKGDKRDRNGKKEVRDWTSDNSQCGQVTVLKIYKSHFHDLVII